MRDRLRAALNQPARQELPAQPRAVTELPDLSGLGGRWFESPHGPGYVIESVYDAGHAHGRVPLHRALSLDTPMLAKQCRDDRLAACDPSTLLYVDTETTGLGGAGAMVFLAGAARFDGSVLRLRQYLLPEPRYEGGLLGGLAGDVARAGALVSYNGKSFDVPVLEARYILSRMRPAIRDLPHLDLLHPNRRLFKGALHSHRLTHIEQELLAFEREDDCPSWEVPERYFAFQRTGDPTHIAPVLRHNAWDILSLVALAAHLADVCGGDAHPLQAARAAEYAGDPAAAADRYEAAIAAGIPRPARLDAIERAARAHARLRDWDAAARWWQALIDEPRARRLRPYVELAKILEHRRGDLAGALDVVDRALALVERGLIRPGPAGSALGVDALRHRQERLMRRGGGDR